MSPGAWPEQVGIQSFATSTHGRTHARGQPTEGLAVVHNDHQKQPVVSNAQFPLRWLTLYAGAGGGPTREQAQNRQITGKLDPEEFHP